MQNLVTHHDQIETSRKQRSKTRALTVLTFRDNDQARANKIKDHTDLARVRKHVGLVERLEQRVRELVLEVV